MRFKLLIMANHSSDSSIMVMLMNAGISVSNTNAVVGNSKLYIADVDISEIEKEQTFGGHFGQFSDSDDEDSEEESHGYSSYEHYSPVVRSAMEHMHGTSFSSSFSSSHFGPGAGIGASKAHKPPKQKFQKVPKELSKEELLEKIKSALSSCEVLGYQVDGSGWVGCHWSWSEYSGFVEGRASHFMSSGGAAGSLVGSAIAESKGEGLGFLYDPTSYDPKVGYKSMLFTFDRRDGADGVDVTTVIKTIMTYVSKWPFLKAVKGVILGKHKFSIQLIGVCTENSTINDLIELIIKLSSFEKEFYNRETRFVHDGRGAILTYSNNALRNLCLDLNTRLSANKAFLSFADPHYGYRKIFFVIKAKNNVMPKIKIDDAEKILTAQISRWELYSKHAVRMVSSRGSLSLYIDLVGLSAADKVSKDTVINAINLIMAAAGLSDDYFVFSTQFYEHGIGKLVRFVDKNVIVDSNNPVVAETKEDQEKNHEVEIDPIHELLILRVKSLLGENTEEYQLVLDSISKKNYSQALRRCCTGADSKLFEIIKILFSLNNNFKLDINEVAVDKKTAMHHAAAKASEEVYQFLLKNGGDETLKDEQDKSPAEIRKERLLEKPKEEKLEMKADVLPKINSEAKSSTSEKSFEDPYLKYKSTQFVLKHNFGLIENREKHPAVIKILDKLNSWVVLNNCINVGRALIGNDKLCIVLVGCSTDDTETKKILSVAFSRILKLIGLEDNVSVESVSFKSEGLGRTIKILPENQTIIISDTYPKHHFSEQSADNSSVPAAELKAAEVATKSGVPVIPVAKFGSPVTAAGDAHEKLVKAIKAVIGNEAAAFKPFLDALEKRTYSKALRIICTSESLKALEVTKIFLKAKDSISLDINKINERAGKDLFSALHYAARNGNKELCALLVQHGADLTLPDASGRAPADYLKEQSVASKVTSSLAPG